MNQKDFRARLKQGPILCDGAMGTLLDLYEYPDLPHDAQNIRNPDIVERIHREYIEAGAEIIQTNTFSANRYRLAQYHLDDRIREINRAGVEIARRAAGDHVFVAGSVGPLGKLLEPLGKVTLKEAREIFEEQIGVLLDTGVDLLILETFVSLTELDQAIAAAKNLTAIPLVAQKTFPEDGSILAGSFPLEVVEHLLSKGVDVVGANCTVGPQRMFSIIRSMYRDGVVLSAQPAAGIPTLLNGRTICHATPVYRAQYARELVRPGLRLIGACCGSTPAHIREIRRVIEEEKGGADEAPVVKAPGRSTGVAPSAEQDGKGRPEEDAGERKKGHRSQFGRKIGRKFLVTVELDVPRGLDMSPMIEGARYLKGFGVDAINVTDGARARLRMSPVAISSLIQSQAGVETVTHLATRDRNMLSLQSELLGAHALGLHTILCVTGDPTSIGDYPQATSVFDIDSSGMIRAATAMNNGVDLMGNSIGEKTSFTIACAANPKADDLDAEIEKLKKKVAGGAHIVFTQPIYDRETLETFLERIRDLSVPVMLGLLPLRSTKHAEFLHNEVPGMVIPDEIRHRLREAGSGAGALGIEIATSFLETAKPMVAGVYLMPPFKKYEIVRQVLEGAGIRPGESGSQGL